MTPFSLTQFHAPVTPATPLSQLHKGCPPLPLLLVAFLNSVAQSQGSGADFRGMLEEKSTTGRAPAFPTAWGSVLCAKVIPGSQANGHKLLTHRLCALSPNFLQRERESKREGDQWCE